MGLSVNWLHAVSGQNNFITGSNIGMPKWHGDVNFDDDFLDDTLDPDEEESIDDE